MTSDTLLLDSITDAGPDARGRVAVCGSHGGLIAGALASQAGLRAVILNDAGVCLNNAGLRGVMALDQVGLAAAAVDCMSAAIGSAADTVANGRLSAVNRTAAELGLRIGQFVAEALPLLSQAPQPIDLLAMAKEARTEVEIIPGAAPIICADSASLIVPEDAGRIIVTGSHGGLIANDPARACKARAAFVAFNDAGGGKDLVGHGRLPALEDQGVAAAVADAMSCEIGSARSALETGRISALNAQAKALGMKRGESLRKGVEKILHCDTLRPNDSQF